MEIATKCDTRTQAEAHLNLSQQTYRKCKSIRREKDGRTMVIC